MGDIEHIADVITSDPDILKESDQNDTVMIAHKTIQAIRDAIKAISEYSKVSEDTLITKYISKNQSAIDSVNIIANIKKIRLDQGHANIIPSWNELERDLSYQDDIDDISFNNEPQD